MQSGSPNLALAVRKKDEWMQSYVEYEDSSTCLFDRLKIDERCTTLALRGGKGDKRGRQGYGNYDEKGPAAEQESSSDSLAMPEGHITQWKSKYEHVRYPVV